MTDWFPSRAWLESYRENLNENDRYAAVSEGWGVDFDGDFVFVVQGLPLAETTVGELPDDLTDPLVATLAALDDGEYAALQETATDRFTDRFAERGDGRDAFTDTLLGTALADVPEVLWPDLRAHLPTELADLLDQLERYVEDGTVHAHLELEDGACRDVELLADPSARDAGFTLAGRYPVWKELIEGADVIGSVMSRDMRLDGSVTTVLEYDEAAAQMGDTAGETPAAYLF